MTEMRLYTWRSPDGKYRAFRLSVNGAFYYGCIPPIGGTGKDENVVCMCKVSSELFENGLKTLEPCTPYDSLCQLVDRNLGLICDPLAWRSQGCYEYPNVTFNEENQ